MPDDRTPEDEQPASPWSVRPSTPPEESGLAARGAEALSRGRSIFNRFRRDRSDEVMQARLPLGDEDEAAPPERFASEAPPIEPARSPWRRPQENASTQPSRQPAMPPRPTPSAGTERLGPTRPEVEDPETARPEAAPPPAEAHEPAPRIERAPAQPPAAVSPPPTDPAAPEVVSTPERTSTSAADAAPAPDGPVEEPSIAATADEESVAARPVLAPMRPALEVPPPAPREADREPALTWASLRPIPVPINPYMVLLAVVVTLVTLAYLLVEPSPRWFLILGAVAVAGGLDGTLRATWRVTYRHDDTTPALFMPAILVLAMPPLIEHNVRGLGVVAAGLAFGVTFFAVVAAQVGSARPGAAYFAWSRTVSIAGTYAAAFAFFSLTYIYDLGLVVSAVATALVALMLAIEVLREGEIDAAETAGYAAAAGAVVGQWRLALHYLPVDGYLAGLAVVLGFLVVTGLLHAYVTRSLDRRATLDHVLVAVAGAALVIGARAAGLA